MKVPLRALVAKLSDCARFLANGVLSVRMRIVSWARRPIQYTWTLAVVQGLLIVFASYFYWRPPDSGAAVAVLGLVAIVMAIRAEGHWKLTEKAAWLALATVLMCVEIRAIQSEHDKHEREQSQARAEQLEKFREVAGGIDRAITNGQKQFNATMSGIKESVDTMTGGDSFCVLWMEPNEFNGAKFMQINVSQQGRYPLRSAYAVVNDWQIMRKIALGQIKDFNAAFRQVDIGDLAVGNSHFVPGFQREELDRYSYTVLFYGLNGSWTEEIRIRKVNGAWTHAVKVTRTKKVLFEKIEPNFPRLAGVPDWNP
jgi:hypothetical protein